MNRKHFLILILVLISSYIGSQDLEKRYLSQANQEYLGAHYKKAYQYINFVLSLHKKDDLPLPARILGEKIYFFYIESLINNKDFENIDDITKQLQKIPALSSSRVSEAAAKIKQMRSQKEEATRAEELKARKLKEEQLRSEEINKALEKERAAQARMEAIRKEERRLYEEKEKSYQEELKKTRQEETSRNEQQQKVLREEMAQAQELEIQRAKQAQVERTKSEQKMIELMKSKDAQDAAQQKEFNDILHSSIKKQGGVTSSSEKMSFYVIILISVIGLFLFLGFGLLIFLSIRHSQDNQRRFENTLHTMQATRNITSINNQFALPDVTESMDHLQLEDASGQKALPAPDDESEKLKEMLQTCKKYGEQIDQVTNRKNNSRNTAELVYKISKEMGYDEKECLLHFAVGMIYDIGFMSIDPEILSRDNVSDEEFGIIKNHVNLGVNMIYFIDRQYHPLFREGILKHHENLDGSGYPSGLRDTEIPYIARVLHIVESFLALISSRNYKAIQDRESAIKQLLTETDKYDVKILEALNEVV